jgi:hypothetical protein
LEIGVVTAQGRRYLSFERALGYLRNNKRGGARMQIGIDSFAMTLADLSTGRLLPASDRMENLVTEVETADQVGIDVFGIGEHHREEFLDGGEMSSRQPVTAERIDYTLRAGAVHASIQMDAG